MGNVAIVSCTAILFCQDCNLSISGMRTQNSPNQKAKTFILLCLVERQHDFHIDVKLSQNNECKSFLFSPLHNKLEIKLLLYSSQTPLYILDGRGQATAILKPSLFCFHRFWDLPYFYPRSNFSPAFFHLFFPSP